MTIEDIMQTRIVPFEIDDIKLQKLFSFFLHNAPTINSNLAMKIDDSYIAKSWDNFLEKFSSENYKFISENTNITRSLKIYNLTNESIVKRKSKGFVCNRKDKNEKDYECLLRHIRNSIAHGNVFLDNAGNRKFIVFEDFNRNGVLKARMLFSQTDLKNLKDCITR